MILLVYVVMGPEGPSPRVPLAVSPKTRKIGQWAQKEKYPLGNNCVMIKVLPKGHNIQIKFYHGTVIEFQRKPVISVPQVSPEGISEEHLTIFNEKIEFAKSWEWVHNIDLKYEIPVLPHKEVLFLKDISHLPSREIVSRLDPEFIHWFVGFTDAEGNFFINNVKAKSSVKFIFTLRLHVDECVLLFKIKEILGVGKVRLVKQVQNG